MSTKELNFTNKSFTETETVNIMEITTVEARSPVLQWNKERYVLRATPHSGKTSNL